MRLPATRLPALSKASMAGAGRMIASGRSPAASLRRISAIVALVSDDAMAGRVEKPRGEALRDLRRRARAVDLEIGGERRLRRERKS